MAVVEYGFNFDHMLHFEGKKFFDSAAVLKEHPVHYSNSPYYVLLAFSIELMLKSLRVKTTITTSKKIPSKVNCVKIEHVKGHALIDVFNEHPQQLKDWLSESISKLYGIDLEGILKDHANLFDEARYLYPKKEINKINRDMHFLKKTFIPSL